MASNSKRRRAELPPVAGAPQKPRIESFEMREVTRAQLRNAPYNPRQIDDQARENLRRGIVDKFGLVQPIVWNERTGNIVGGHARVSICDGYYGKRDYTLQVAVVNVDSTREKELNILLNNPEAQGQYTLDKLAEILKTPGIDVYATGFTPASVYKLLGENTFANAVNQQALDQLATQLREARARYESIGKGTKKRDDAEFYALVVFGSPDDRAEFFETLGLEDNRYQDARELRRLLERRTEDEQALRLLAFEVKERAGTEGASPLSPDVAFLVERILDGESIASEDAAASEEKAGRSGAGNQEPFDGAESEEATDDEDAQTAATIAELRAEEAEPNSPPEPSRRRGGRRKKRSPS
jgi:ParB-like chromosome segregation protein Spo0J